MMEGEEGLG